jgi:hypothetical protein
MSGKQTTTLMTLYRITIETPDGDFDLDMKPGDRNTAEKLARKWVVLYAITYGIEVSYTITRESTTRPRFAFI